jgi:hypothetical protein
LSIEILFGVLFYFLLVSDSCYLDAAMYENLQDLEEKDFEQLQGARVKFIDHVDPIFFLPQVHTIACLH